MYLAQNLKYLRTKAGKQQKELALILNVSKATMAKYENGMVEPNIEMIVRMAEYFGVTLAFKYACFQIFCIPTEEMKDPDAECHDVQPKGNGSNRGSGSRSSGKQGNNASQAESRPQGNTQKQKAADEQANAEMMEQANKALIDGTKVKVIKDTIRKKGLSEASILGHYKLKNFEDIFLKAG